MNKYFLIILSMFLSLGCARVRVEAPREPIKVDVSMRLDIYQHVTKDIDTIENMVSGAQEKSNLKDTHSFLNYFVTTAFAQGELGPEVESAALRRKNRHSELESWETQGLIGENKLGMVEIRLSVKSNPAIEELVNAENGDRMIIYQGVSRKNNAPLEDVQKLYAKRLHADAPAGTPIEILDETDNEYKWQIKK